MKRNQISAWPMLKSEFCTSRKLKQLQFDNLFDVRSIEKTRHIEAWNRTNCFLQEYNFRMGRGFHVCWFFEVFSILWMKKFPYLKLGPFGNPIILTHTEINISKLDANFNIWQIQTTWSTHKPTLRTCLGEEFDEDPSFESGIFHRLNWRFFFFHQLIWRFFFHRFK